MPDLEKTGAELVLEINNWERNAKQAAKLAELVERDLEGMYDAADRAEKSLNKIDGTYTAKVTTNDADVDATKRKVDGLDTTVMVDVEVNDGGGGAWDVFKGNLAADLTVGAITWPLGAFDKVLRVTGIDYIAGMDAAEGFIEGTTRGVEGASGIVEQLYLEMWGTQEEIAQTVAALSRAGVEDADLEDAARSAFEVASVMEEDVGQIIRAQTSLVRNELVPSYREAADVMTSGFRDGLNIGDDYLDSIIEYGTTYKDLGFTVDDMLSQWNAFLLSGGDNTDRVADLTRELGIRVGDLGDTATQEALEGLLGSENVEAFQAGETTFEEFYNGIISGLENMEPGPLRDTITAQLFGTIAEDFGTDAVLALNDVEYLLSVIGDDARDAASSVNDNLGTAIGSVQRLIEVETAHFLDETFDISGRIDTFKAQVQTMFDELSSGEGLLASIEIAFGLEGFEDTVQSFRRGITDLSIGLLEFIRDVKSFLGRDTTGDDRRIAQLGSFALEADLGEIEAGDLGQYEAINRAIGRGVSNEAIAEIIQGRVQAAIASGDITSLTQFGGIQAQQGADYGLSNMAYEEIADIGRRFQGAQTIGGAFGGIQGLAADAAMPDFSNLDIAQMENALDIVGELATPTAEVSDNMWNLSDAMFEAQESSVTMATETEASITTWSDLMTTNIDHVRDRFLALETSADNAGSSIGRVNAILGVTNFSFNPGGGSSTTNNNVTINNNSPAQAAQSNNLVGQLGGAP